MTVSTPSIQNNPTGFSSYFLPFKGFVFIYTKLKLNLLASCRLLIQRYGEWKIYKNGNVLTDSSHFCYFLMKYWIIERLIKILKSYFGSLFCVFLCLDNPALLLVTPIYAVLFENFIKSLLAFFIFKSCIVPICFVIPAST